MKTKSLDEQTLTLQPKQDIVEWLTKPYYSRGYILSDYETESLISLMIKKQKKEQSL